MVIDKKKILSIIERMALTFVGAFIAVYLLSFSNGQAGLAFLKDPNILDKALTAGIASIVPLVSGLIGIKVGDKNTGSLIKVTPTEPEVQPLPLPTVYPQPTFDPNPNAVTLPQAPAHVLPDNRKYLDMTAPVNNPVPMCKE